MAARARYPASGGLQRRRGHTRAPRGEDREKRLSSRNDPPEASRNSPCRSRLRGRADLHSRSGRAGGKEFPASPGTTKNPSRPRRYWRIPPDSSYRGALTEERSQLTFQARRARDCVSSVDGPLALKIE